MKNNKLWAFLLLVFFVAGVAGSYFLLHKRGQNGSSVASPPAPNALQGAEEVFDLRLSYPIDESLQMIEKKLPKRTRQTAIAEAAIEEFLKGPGNGKTSRIPANVKLLGIYRDPQQILYVDLSDEFRRNFQGSALDEYLLLKGLYASVTSNIQDVQDVKILIEGKEIETLGGHFFLKYPLRNIVSGEFKGSKVISGE